MIIDIHTHAWPEKVSQKAKDNLEGLFKVKLIGDPTIKTLQFYMDKNSIDISVVCGVATRHEQVPSINDWLISVRSSRIKVFCALHPEYKQWKNELLRLKGKADGIKFQPEFQNFYIDDEKVFKIYETMQDLGMPIMFHCGKELSGTMLVRSSPDRLIKIRKAFPKLKIIAAHFGGFQLWDDVEKYLIGEDIYLDTSFFLGHLEKDKIINLISSHREDRILFGTDFPLIDQIKDIDYLKSLGLSEEAKEKIFFRNACDLLSIKC